MVTSGIHVENLPLYPFVDHFPRETHWKTTTSPASEVIHWLHGAQSLPHAAPPGTPDLPGKDVCGDVSEILGKCPMLYGKMIMGYDSRIYIYIIIHNIIYLYNIIILYIYIWCIRNHVIFEKNDGIWLQYTDLYPSIKMVYEWEKSDGKSREIRGGIMGKWWWTSGFVDTLW